MYRLFSFINRIILFSAICLAIGVAILAYGFFYYSKDLPNYEQLAEYHPPIVTRLYTNNEQLLEEYAIEHRVFVPITAIPKKLVNGFIAAEDKNFYIHAGIDITSIFRAIFLNVTNVGQKKSLVGGSTITQQVVKNFLLTNEKSFVRKIKEAILSFRISRLYSKERILELYLNQIYLGGKSYGVASAALNYFNKSIDELSIEEIAYIAALPKAPSNYDIEKNYNKAKNRRDWVIDRMAEEKFVSAQEAKDAKEKPIIFHKRKDRTDIVKAEFFAEGVRREIASKYGAKSLYEGGLVIKTTLDPRLQSFAEQAFRQGTIEYDQRHGYRGPVKKLGNIDNWQEDLVSSSEYFNESPWKLAIVLEILPDKIKIGLGDDSQAYINMSSFAWTKYNLKSPKEIFEIGDLIYVEEKTNNNQISYHLRQIPKVNGGFIAMEPKTGRIVALVGGFDPKKSEFNRATQAKRQPGSVFKPFVYLTALENGYSPSSLILDGPIELSQGKGLPTWKPRNYSRDFLGPTTLRKGLEKSRNTMTVRLALDVGVKKIMNITKRFGIYDNPIGNFSIALGSQDTTLLDMTNAYAILLNNGQKVTPSMIESIEDQYGKIIFKRDHATCQACIIDYDDALFKVTLPRVKNEQEQVIDPATAYQMVSILEGVVQRGTAARARSLGAAVGGKTGTTNDSKDAWFVGFTSDLIVGTYVGYDQPKNLGDRETGASVALPIFINFMENYLKNKVTKPFNIPKGIKLVRIDPETGKETSGKNAIYEAYRTNNALTRDENIALNDNMLDENVIKDTNQDIFEIIDDEDLNGIY